MSTFLSDAELEEVLVQIAKQEKAEQIAREEAELEEVLAQIAKQGKAEQIAREEAELAKAIAQIAKQEKAEQIAREKAELAEALAQIAMLEKADRIAHEEAEELELRRVLDESKNMEIAMWASFASADTISAFITSHTRAGDVLGNTEQKGKFRAVRSLWKGM